MLYDRKVRIKLLLLIFFGTLVYTDVLPNNFIDDDYFQIVHNPQVKSIKNIPAFFAGSTYFRVETGESYGLYYRPLMLSVYTVIYSIVHADPLYFHLFQIAVHLANAILVFFIFKKFFSQNSAFISSLVFLIHPINQEAVAFIADLQDVLFVFFGLSALWLLLHNFGSGFSTVAGVRFHTWEVSLARWIVLGVLLLLSLFSKESGILLVFLIGWYFFLFEKANLKKYLLIGTVVLLGYGVFRFGLAGSHITDQKLTPISQAPLGSRLLNSPKIITSYLTLLIFPKDLALNQMWMVPSVRSSQFVVPGIMILSLCMAFTCWRIRGIRGFRGAEGEPGKILFFLGWFVAGILLHIQIIPLNATFTSRWFYFATIGLLGVLAIIVLDVMKQNEYLKKLAPFVLVCIIIALSIRTIVRNQDWRDERTLFSRDIQSSGGNYYLENNLASILIHDKKYDEAKVLVTSSIRQFPYFGNINNMALILVQENNYDDAEKYFEKALDEKGSYMVYQNYANFLIHYKKDKERALIFLDQAILIYPKSQVLRQLQRQVQLL